MIKAFLTTAAVTVVALAYLTVSIVLSSIPLAAAIVVAVLFIRGCT